MSLRPQQSNPAAGHLDSEETCTDWSSFEAEGISSVVIVPMEVSRILQGGKGINTDVPTGIEFSTSKDSDNVDELNDSVNFNRDRYENH